MLVFLLSVFFGCLIVLMERRARQLRQSLQDLREAHDRIETIMKVVPAGLFQVAADSQILYVNERWSAFTGFSSEDALGHGWKAGLLPQDISRIEKEFQNASSRKERVQLVYQYRSKGGEMRWLHTNAVPHLNEEGQLICYYGAAIDFTQRKEAEAELVRNRNIMSAILENLPVALVCKDAENNFAYMFANKKCQEMLGKTEQELVSKTDFDFFSRPAAENIRSEDTTVFETGKMFEDAGRDLLLPTGKLVHIHTRRVPLYDENGKVSMVLCIYEDRTSQRDFEKLIEEQRLKLIHAEKMSALGEMAGGIAHEINTPLTVIELNAGQLKMQLANGVRELEVLSKYPERISNTVQRIAKIVRGLKAFARDGEKDPFEIASVEAMIRESFEFCQGRFQQQGVEFQLGVMPKDLMVAARTVQLSQVFLNLLNNAFDAVCSQSSAWVRVDAFDYGDEVEIAFTDSGAGISPELAKKIMQPFFTTKDVGKGTGLGLSVSLAIVQDHHGSVSLDANHPNTRFVVRLPKYQKMPAHKKAS